MWLCPRALQVGTISRSESPTWSTVESGLCKPVDVWVGPGWLPQALPVTATFYSVLSPSDGPAERPGDPAHSQPAGGHVGPSAPGEPEREHTGLQGKCLAAERSGVGTTRLSSPKPGTAAGTLAPRQSAALGLWRLLSAAGVAVPWLGGMLLGRGRALPTSIQPRVGASSAQGLFVHLLHPLQSLLLFS